MRMRDAGLVLAAAVFAGCGTKEAPKPAGGGTEAGHDHGHGEPGPHGGEILEVGEEAAHVELVHDAKAGTLAVHVLGPDRRTAMPVAAPVINLTTKAGPVQITMEAVGAAADGTASQWTAKHDALAADPLDGRIRLTLAGKTHQVPLAHEH